jgi:hypothetical protein
MMPDVEGRKGESRKTTVRQLDLSRSSDIAYEFTDVELTITAPAQHERT